ncbi:hypothetical protein HJC23_008082 [Cyclotella cryptica]|uniref:CN hydrolase domain-containing protein n=1 Tax=Cyclotella cryptica TaxID=29204 RepID=A0ABD3PFE5_9STRA
MDSAHVPYCHEQQSRTATDHVPSQDRVALLQFHVTYDKLQNIATALWAVLSYVGQRVRAVDGQCFVLTASPARAAPPEKEQKYPHYAAWGNSAAVSPWGEVMASCDENPNIAVVDLDMKKVAEMRMAIPTSNQKRHDLYKLTTGGGPV